MLIGAHVPSDPDFRKIFSYARSVGCECLQMFLRSPRMWSAPPLKEERLASLDAARDEGIDLPILVHTAYLINLATDKPDNEELSVSAFVDELEKAERIGAQALNTHVGSSKILPRDRVASRIADRIEEAYTRAGITDPKTRLVLENTAGSGSTFGTTISELAEIHHELANRGLPAPGICIDTAHAWAAGYDVSSRPGWDELLDEVDGSLGLENLIWIHANDSLMERGSLRDRHAWIGEGTIGYEGFRVMTSDPRLSHVDVVLEMPGTPPVKDERNITVLKMMRETGRVPDEDTLATLPSQDDEES